MKYRSLSAYAKTFLAFLVFSFAMLFVEQAHGQVIQITPSPDSVLIGNNDKFANKDVFIKLVAGTNYSSFITCTLSSFPSGEESLTYQKEADWIGVKTTNDSLVLDASPRDDHVGEWILTIKETVSDSTRRIHIEVERPPIDIMLLLDVSASMNNSAYNNTEGNDSDEGQAMVLSPSKWEEVSKVMGNLVVALKSDIFSIADDSITIAYFGDTVSDVTSWRIKDLPGNFSPVKTPGENEDAAMGLGLLVSEAILQKDDSKGNFIILITDGHQSDSTQATFLGRDNTGVTFVHEQDKFPEQSVFGKCGNGLPIYVIQVGEGINVDEALLEQVASGSQGEKYVTNRDVEFNLSNSLTAAITQALAEFSPQIVARRRGVFGSNGVQELFEINQGVTGLYLELHWKAEDDINPELTIGKRVNGEFRDLTSFFRRSPEQAKNFQIYELPYPAFDSDTNFISPAGTWEVNIQGDVERADYQLTAVVDEHNLDIETQPNSYLLKSGEPLPLQVALSYSGKPVEDALIEAIVYRPGDDLSSILSTSDLSISDINNEQLVKFDGSMNNAQKKQELLLQNQKIRSVLKPKIDTIRLFPSKIQENAYVGSFRNTDVNGSYQVEYQIRFELDSVGAFIRTQTESYFVEFGNIDTRLSLPQSRPCNRDSLLIKVRPRNSKEHYLGPGYAKQIRLNYIDKTNNLKRANIVTDNLDGSYTYAILCSDINKDQQIAISVLGDSLFVGSAKELPDGDFDFNDNLRVSPSDSNIVGDTVVTTKPWLYASLHLGAAIPTDLENDFFQEQDFNPRYLVEADLEARFGEKRNLGIELVGGSYSFDPEFLIWGISAYFKYYQNFNDNDRFRAYLGAGGGYYKPDNLDGQGGFSGQLGLQWALDQPRKFWFDVKGSYFNLSQQDIQFVGASVGLKYGF